MTTGESRHGRRDNHGRCDNGLVAAEYASAGDVDPRVGEHLLDVLALEGIAAYLRPSTDLHPVTRSSSLPSRPTDRLYVDRAHLATARSLVARLAAEGDDDRPQADGTQGAAADVDAAWASIVAGYDADLHVPRRPWPPAEDVTEPRSGDAGADAHEGGLLRAAPDDQLSLLDGLDTFGANLPDEDDEGFTPPSPPPLPRPSMPTALGIAGIIAGLVIFIGPGLLPVGEGTAMLAGFCALLAGFVTLIWRLRPGDEDDNDTDDGAKV